MGRLISPCHSPAFILGKGTEYIKANNQAGKIQKLKSNYKYNSEMNILKQNDAKLSTKSECTSWRRLGKICLHWY